ncbi:hypothetical protein [Leucobacter sp. UCD-THU]|uniref:hypothetical protein n=1 Tax=Leucobacter sp. UCD-THU TaxID=1292023 RepID=UPI0003A9E8D2|nr:hypothetical protein [Leucobacter sp. UCD-THU]
MTIRRGFHVANDASLGGAETARVVRGASTGSAWIDISCAACGELLGACSTAEGGFPLFHAHRRSCAQQGVAPGPTIPRRFVDVIDRLCGERFASEQYFVIPSQKDER